MTMWEPRLDVEARPRYLAIADAIGEDVVDGRLAGGQRLPTHRELADTLGVTVGTVSRAYAEAARRGLISGEVGRGTFVRAMAAPAASLPDSDFVDLTHNHPASPGDALDVRVMRTQLLGVASDPGLVTWLGYPPDGGHPSHRAAGAAWLERSGVEAPPDRVVITSGSQHGLASVLASLLGAGDLLLAEELTYPGLKGAAGLLGLRLHGVPIDGEGLDPDAFESECRSTGARVVYCVPTIQNPTSSVMSAERREQIVEIARRHDVTIIEDDIHALLPEQRPAPLASLAPERTYYLATTSKMLTPGLRIGYVLTPPGQVDVVTQAVRSTTWAASPLTAELASRSIEDGSADTVLDARRREARSRQRMAREALQGLDYDAHPSGYHLWLKLPEPWRSDTFSDRLRRRGVAVTPSETFVVGRGATPHAVRLALGGCARRESLGRALGIVRDVLDRPGDTGFSLV